MKRMKSQYTGRREDYGISYPCWLFTVSGKDENKLTDEEWELLGSLTSWLNDWLQEHGYRKDAFMRAVCDCGGVWVTYDRYYGVTQWKECVAEGYRRWKQWRRKSK